MNSTMFIVKYKNAMIYLFNIMYYIQSLLFFVAVILCIILLVYKHIMRELFSVHNVLYLFIVNFIKKDDIQKQ